MKKIIIRTGLMACLVLTLLGTSVAQKSISGVVLDSDNVPVIGASVIVVGTSIGTVTDVDGTYNLNLPEGSEQIEIAYLGFNSRILNLSDGNYSSITLEEAFNQLNEVVVTGSRGKPRTILGSPVPIDNINAAELIASGQNTVDQMLNFKIPSYNSSNQTVSDATAHFDPSELRNLGPSRTLVLINGKRKNQSALVYVNDTPGKGEVGTDMKSIPVESIERVEVLRDGAAAQYGSDAIAGVVNIILKKRTDAEITVNSGITTEGDGLLYDIGINKGFAIGKKGGFINLTGSYYHQDYTDRAGEPGGDGLFGVIFGDDDILNGNTPWQQANPDLGMIIGQPEFDKFSGMINFGLPYGSNGDELYANWGYTYRDGTSFALYRAPYWITDDAGLLTPPGEEYQGFQPTFETAIGDLTFTAGTRNKLGKWDSDLSFSYGENSVAYTIGNTINVDLLPNSPTEFDAGEYRFGNIVANYDISRSFDKLTVSLGTEVRNEFFDVEEGQEESYIGGGAQSFPGLQPSNALSETRFNVGVYGGLDYDLSENTLVGGAVRFENYSDFGSNVSWKLNARQFIAEKKGAIRASVSTGFRAPSLHQVFLSNVQTLVSGGTISNQGTFNNVSDVIVGLGVPSLDAETSLNFTAGLTYQLVDGLTIAADYYNIRVDNRVLFTGEIGFDGDDSTTNSVEEVLIANDVTSIKYFVNALDTRTTGLDVVLDYGSKKFDAVVSANFNNTEILNDEITSPGEVGAAGYEIFNRKEQSRITSARPNTKILVGLTGKFDNFRVALNNTYFGEVTWQHATDPSLDQTFTARVITDLLLGYNFTEKFRANITVNNLLNVFPDEIETGGDFVTDLGGRFRYPWEVNQFGFNGTYIKAGLSYKF